MTEPYSFPGQQPDEKIVLVLHRHWLPFVGEVFRLTMLAAIPAVLLWAGLKLAERSIDQTGVGFAAIVFGFALYYLLLVTILYGFWLDYYLDVFVVTNKRLVDIEQRGLLSRTIAEQPLYRIQDVTSEVNGMLAHLFRYGNVYVQSAGEKVRFYFEQVSHPELVVRTILSMTDASVSEARAKHKIVDPRTGVSV